MRTTTKVILAAAAATIVFAIARSDTSPRRMAEVELNSCYRNLPSSTDIFRVAERHAAKQRCDIMKELYVKHYKVPYTNY